MHPQAPAAVTLTAVATVAYCCFSSKKKHLKLSKGEPSDDALREIESYLLRHNKSIYRATRILGTAVEGRLPQDKIDMVAGIAKDILAKEITEILKSDKIGTTDELFVNTVVRLGRVIHGCSLMPDMLNTTKGKLLSEILTTESLKEFNNWMSKQRRFGYSAFFKEITSKSGGRALSLISSIISGYVKSAAASSRLDLHDAHPDLIKDDIMSFLKVTGLSLSAVAISYLNGVMNERLRIQHTEENRSLMTTFIIADLKLLQRIDIQNTASSTAYNINIIHDSFGDLQSIILNVTRVGTIISHFGGEHDVLTSVAATAVALMLEIASGVITRKQIISRHSVSYEQRSGEIPALHEFYSKLLTYRIHGRDLEVGKSAQNVEWIDTTPSLYHTFMTEGASQLFIQDLFFTIAKRFGNKQMLKEVMTTAPEFMQLYRSAELYKNRSFWASAACIETLRQYVPTIDNGDSSRVRLPQNCTPSLSVKNISFSFNEKKILNNISLDIPFGSHVGIVGPSGCGKSTFLKLLTRLYDTDSGSIFIEGIDIKNIELSQLRKELMSVVCEESEILDTTILENVRLAKPDSSKEEVRRVLDIVNALKDVNEVGLGAKLGWGGVELSSGQFSRLLFARALLASPKVLLLDEISAHLDPSSEDAIRTYLNTLRGKSTIINVAHRLSFLRECDIVFVFNTDGQVSASGTHDELMQTCDWYETACQHQKVGSPRFDK